MFSGVLKSLRGLYGWTLHWAGHRHNTKALATLATVEAIFFPIPPEVLLVAMGAAHPKRAFKYAIITSLASTFGAMIGYMVGAFLWDTFDEFFFTNIFSVTAFTKVAELYKENALLTVFVAAFTPIPFKVFTVTAGVFRISLVALFVGSLVGRTIRYCLIAAVLYFYGEKAKVLIEKYFDLFIIGITALVIASFVALKYWF